MACSRVRGAFRCRVTQAGTTKLKLAIKRGKRLIAIGSGRAGKRVVLSGGPVKAGRYTVAVTLTKSGKKATVKRTVRIR